MKVDKRVSTWLEAVPAVLEYLKVKHVAVASHSAGTIYVINTVVHLSYLLHPSRPFVACFGKLSFSLSSPHLCLCSCQRPCQNKNNTATRKRKANDEKTTAPWVHPIYSSAPLMQVVDKLPTSLLGNLHHVQGFVASYIAPSITFSAAKLGVSESLDEETCSRVFGMSKETREKVVKLQQQWQRNEGTRSVLTSLCFLVCACICLGSSG